MKPDKPQSFIRVQKTGVGTKWGPNPTPYRPLSSISIWDNGNLGAWGVGAGGLALRQLPAQSSPPPPTKPICPLYGLGGGGLGLLSLCKLCAMISQFAILNLCVLRGGRDFGQTDPKGENDELHQQAGFRPFHTGFRSFRFVQGNPSLPTRVFFLDFFENLEYVYWRRGKRGYRTAPQIPFRNRSGGCEGIRIGKAISWSEEEFEHRIINPTLSLLTAHMPPLAKPPPPI